MKEIMTKNSTLIELQNTVFKNFNIPLEDVLNLKIYHYIKYDYFIKIIEDEKLLFDRVINWKDKYENFLFKAQIIVNGKKLSFEKFAPWVYAKCFSIEEESFAMWIDPNRSVDCIKYETTVEDIFNSIYKSGIHNLLNERKFTFRIGKVEYKTKSEIQSFYKNKLLLNPELITELGNELLDSMFIKRVEYKFEKELRAAILFENFSTENINPLTLNHNTYSTKINSIVFHPEISYNIFEERKEFLKKMGFNNIKKSDILDNTYLKINIKT